MIFSKIRRKFKYFLHVARDKFKYNESESKLAADNQDYWNQDYSDSNLAQDAHWKDKGKFEDHQRWHSLGKEHLDLVKSYSTVFNFQFPVDQIVEWGCGGGANAVHFAPITKKFVGIDITKESLEECNKQILDCGLNNFKPVLVNASTPESILKENINNVDLFICTYVYELFPSTKYGLNVLKLGYDMLGNNGVAFVQIRYNDGNKKQMSKLWGYKLHPYTMTSYTIEEFWESSRMIGFEPLGIYLKPYQQLVNDRRYAYFFLKKKV